MRHEHDEQLTKHAAQWQQREETMCHIMLGILGTIFTIYLQKIEGLLLGSQWMVLSMSISSAILLMACWYRRQLIDSASLYLVRIRNIEFRVHQDVLPLLYPIWWDCAVSDDVSRADILDALQYLPVSRHASIQ